MNELWLFITCLWNTSLRIPQIIENIDLKLVGTFQNHRQSIVLSKYAQEFGGPMFTNSLMDLQGEEIKLHCTNVNKLFFVFGNAS